MNRNAALISVILPVYNGADTLAEALASIQQQTGAAIEIIVVDDGSTDASAAVARRSGDAVTRVTQSNQGPAAARNRGLQLAHGEFVAFLDADDYWPVGRVQHHMQIFAETPHVDIVIGPTQMVHMAPESAASPLLPAPLIQHHLGSATYRRAVFDRVGVFDSALRVGEDRDWFLRALTAGVVTQTTRVISLVYRIRQGSLTYGTIDHAHWFLAALRADLHRRRRSTGGVSLTSSQTA